jgi:hypothetical protein
MVKEQISLQMEIHIRVLTLQVNLMASVSINGRMGAYMWESSKMDLNMARVNGKSCKMF